MLTAFGKRIKFFRQKKEVSQLELEVSINAANGSISRIESGKTNPTKETLLSIARVLELNEREIDYLIGTTAEPVSDELILKARAEVQGLVKKKGELMYLIDDRYRLIDVSDSYCKAINFTMDQKEKCLGHTIVSLMVQPELNLLNTIHKDHREEVMYHLLHRYYMDTGFMEDDMFYQKTIEAISKDVWVSQIWKRVKEENKINIQNIEARTITFSFYGIKIPLIYSSEPLMRYTRFDMIEYTPSSRLIKMMMTL